MPIKNTDFNFSIKSMQEDGSFAGYASVFGIVDSQNDVVMKGSFVHTLKKRKGEIRLLWQHLVTDPIGVFSSIREDSHGLYVEGRLLLDLQRGREAYSLLKNSAINGLSIGYNVTAADYNAENNIRLITELELWEISLVTFPANEAAVVTSVKKLEKIGKLESRIKDSCFADSSVIDSIEWAISVLVC